MIDTDVDCLIETLQQLIDFNCPSHTSKSPWILKERKRFELLYKELNSLRTFLSYSEETRYTVPEVKALVIRIIDVASKVEDMVDSFVSSFAVKNPKDFDQNPCFDLDGIRQEIQAIKGHIHLHDVVEAIQAIKGHIGFADYEARKVLKDEGSSSRVNTTIPKEDKIVGFDVETREVLDRLVGDQKKLDVISIVGMGGLGIVT